LKPGKKSKIAGLIAARWNFWTAAATVIVLYTLAAMLHVHARLQVVDLGYQLSREFTNQRKLKEEWQRLSIEAATLRHPRRIRAIATEQLGLVEPAPGQILQAAERGGSKRR